MKLPFKLPSFKLPAIKLPFIGKKKAEEDDDSGEDEDWGDIDVDAIDSAPAPEGEAADPESEEGEPAAAEEGGDETPPSPAAAEDAPPADPTDGSEEESDPSALEALEDTLVSELGEESDQEDTESDELEGGKKRLMMIIGAAVGGVLLLVGVGWFIFAGGDDDEHAEEDDSGVPRFEMAIAPKERGATEGSLNAISAGEKGPGAGVVSPATTLMAFAKIAPPQATDGPLADIKDPALIEQSHQGPLPKISEDGRQPWQVYAKSFDTKDARPKIALIVTGLGQSQAATEAAISLLPGSVTLAFDPYAPNLQEWADKARQAGHEVLIMMPLEPLTFPGDDPGPQGLMTFNTDVENLLRLEYVLARMRGYVGVISVLGSKFNQEDNHVTAFLTNLKNRGLLFVDGSADPKSLAPALAEKMELPKAFADIVLDSTPTKMAVDARLGELENVVRSNANAVALIEAYPVSIERIADWVASLQEKKLVLAPVSAIANRQFLQ